MIYQLISDPENNLYPNGHFRDTMKDLTVKVARVTGNDETKSSSQNQQGINKDIQA